LWYLLNLALWWKHYIAGRPLEGSEPGYTKTTPRPVAMAVTA